MRKPAPRSLNSFSAASRCRAMGVSVPPGGTSKIRVRALVRPANAPAKLVQLGQAHAVGAIDHDGVRARDIEAVLDDRGGNKNVRFVADEFQHHLFEFGLAHLAVAHHDARLRNQPLDHRCQRSDGFHAVVHEEHLALARQLFFDHALHQRLAERRHRGLNRQAVLRRRFDHAHVAQADERHVQRSRDGRRGHGQHVHVLAHFLQALFVRHAEALLFIHHQQAQVLKFDVLRKQPVRADDDVHFPGFELLESFLLLFFGAEAAEHVDAHRKRREAAPERFVVLEREHRGRREHGHLLRIGKRFERGAHGHFRLAVADVAAEQPVHGKR